MAVLMRASSLLLIGLVACKTEVGYGTYLCGVEQDCPDGQACNGPDNRCVHPAVAIPFACEPQDEHEPDDVAADAFALPEMACVSQPTLLSGCLHAGESEDWVRFDVPAACTAVVARMRLSYPLAYEDVQFEIADADGTVLEMETACDASDTSLEDLGILAKCLKRTVTPGASYTIRVKTDGALSCGGACAFNRYKLSVRLETPQP
ncbi:MAG: hypothetical protein NT062_20705 [Proteobacteria bacterium]|nr:hypothetical protein [Pseudomonadota bacterium]